MNCNALTMPHQGLTILKQMGSEFRYAEIDTDDPQLMLQQPSYINVYDRWTS